MPEARLDDSGSGFAPRGEGWFVVNVRDAEWWTSETFGSACRFESGEFGFPHLGVNVRVLEPGKPNCLYHTDSQQEAFLVLSGECRLLVDGMERVLRAWDFFHCPAGTEHVFVGADDGPCVILMVGARSEDKQLLYPVSELAAGYGASAGEETSDPIQAYAHQDVDRAEVTGNENELRLRTTKPEISESGATTTVVWTDGSCNANGIQGRGGWAALIEQAGTVREMSGGADDTTQNRMSSSRSARRSRR